MVGLHYKAGPSYLDRFSVYYDILANFSEMKSQASLINALPKASNIQDFVSTIGGDFLGQKGHSVPMLSPSSGSGDAESR